MPAGSHELERFLALDRVGSPRSSQLTFRLFNLAVHPRIGLECTERIGRQRPAHGCRNGVGPLLQRPVMLFYRGDMLKHRRIELYPLPAED